MSKERELLRQALDAISRGGMTPNEEFLAAEISAFLAAEPEADELKDDAFKLLIALQEAWPYVHDGCTIKSKKERITHLLRKHGDFADLYQPRPEPARKPMSEEEIREITWGPVGRRLAFMEGIRAAEKHHKIGEDDEK